MLDKGSQTGLTLLRMPHGGFVVSEDYRGAGGVMMQFYFASTSIDEALNFMRDAINPNRHDGSVVCREGGANGIREAHQTSFAGGGMNHATQVKVHKGEDAVTVEQVMQVIDRATEPKVMSKAAALDFLEQIETDLQGRMEALREEIGDE